MESVSPVASAGFWSTLLGLPAVTRGDAPRVTLTGGTDLVFVPETGPKHTKNRVHPDLASASGEHRDAVVRRALALGASHADIGQRDVPWIVLRDPEGNEFCVLEPRPEYRDVGPVAAVVVDALDPPLLAAFWSRTTGLTVVREEAEYASLRGDSGFWLEFVRVREPKSTANRLRFAVTPATRPHPGADLVDPEGNEFHLLPAR